jgi:hypothetical protein
MRVIEGLGWRLGPFFGEEPLGQDPDELRGLLRGGAAA